jgi:hypothetical protein
MGVLKMQPRPRQLFDDFCRLILIVLGCTIH